MHAALNSLSEEWNKYITLQVLTLSRGVETHTLAQICAMSMWGQSVAKGRPVANLALRHPGAKVHEADPPPTHLE